MHREDHIYSANPVNSGKTFVPPMLKCFAAVLAVTLALFADFRPQAVAQEIDCFAKSNGSLALSMRTVRPGQPITVYWAAQAPVTCETTFFLDGEPLPYSRNGSKVVYPTDGQIFELRANTSGGDKVLETETVRVVSTVVRIEGSSQTWKDLLLASLRIPGTKIILAPGVDMDLSGARDIEIAESVQLTGDDGGPVRAGLVQGPRIFTKLQAPVFFKIACGSINSNEGRRGHNVKLSGFRLIGPNFNIPFDERHLSRGIRIDSCVGIEISNMEIAGWSNSAVEVYEDLTAQQINTPDDIYIHDNFIHHNQFEGRLGYGVVVRAGAFARIERNVFDFNRHAIAAPGTPTVGYYARHNLVLSGGGFHKDILTKFYTHQFDVHGDETCFPGHLNCGNGGYQFWFIDNSFQYTSGPSIKLRGKPHRRADIFGNIFPAPGDDAVVLQTPENVVFGTGNRANTYNLQTYGKYGVCDFDGDGRDDLFLPTGKTWWMSSGGKMHWTFLKDATEMLHQVGLGDFDADGRCDVIAKNTGAKTLEISSAGRGAWTQLHDGTYIMPFDQLRFADFNGDRRTDIFWRSGTGQWYYTSPQSQVWIPLQSSSLALSSFKFGDFTGDGRADVLAVTSNAWHISISGLGVWTKINSLKTPLADLLVGDFDANGIDDLMQVKVQDNDIVSWSLSRDGRTPWQAIGSYQFGRPLSQGRPYVSFLGRFNVGRGHDLLILDRHRSGNLVVNGATAIQPYGGDPH